MTERGYINDIYKQLEEITKKCDGVSLELKSAKKEIRSLKNEIHIKDKQIKKLQEENVSLKNEVLRLKNKNNKDSSNSSKPSSTNGYKKVITNRREKSCNKKGGQLNHPGTSLSKKDIDNLINSGNVKFIKHEINKNEFNKNKKPIVCKVIDIIITKVIHEYWYYPDENNKFNIPKEHRKNITYGNTLKAVCSDLMYETYNSTDSVKNFISCITNQGINLSKGTLINWSKKLSQYLQPQIKNIESQLVDSYYLNCDDSQIKINGNNSNNICACNNKYTRLWISKSKSHKALEEIGFLNKYVGIIVKDGTDVYNGFCVELSQCISHIQRYLKEITDNNSHEGPVKMKKFLTKWNERRNYLISQNIENFSDKEYSDLLKEYNEIIAIWKKEWIKSEKANNLVYDEERKLLTRFETDDKDQILFFLKDFKVPSTNNQAEVDQRNIKIKQKIGKFRSDDGANYYATIRSCINTYKKNNINVLSALTAAFNQTPILI